MGTSAVTEVTNALAQGWSFIGVQPNPGGQLPASARRPQRGSGRRYVFSFSDPRQPQPQRVNVTLGFAHAAGTMVVPFGYHSTVKNDPLQAGGPFQDRIRVGGATLREPLPRNTPVTLLYAPVPTYTNGQLQQLGPARFDWFPQVIDAAATDIPVLWVAPFGDPPIQPTPPVQRPPGGGASQPNPPGGVEALPNQLGGWPSRGIVRLVSWNRDFSVISVERVLYRGLDPARRMLTGCIRGVEGTVAAPHFLFGAVMLESIVVSDPTDYPDRPQLSDGRVHVSLYQPATGLVEWLSVQKCAAAQLAALGLMMIPAQDTLTVNLQSRPSFAFPYLGDLISQMLTMNGDLGLQPGLVTVSDPTAYDFGQHYKEVLKRWESNLSRAAKGTSKPPAPTGHPAGLQVVPTFATRVADREESGAGDIVTVLDDAQPPDEEARIVHAAQSDYQRNAQQRAQGNVGDACDGWLVAFDTFVSREYQGARHARLARWPTGNLHSVPDLTLGSARAPGFQGEQVDGAPGTLTARIDDLSSHQLLVRLDALNVDAVATTALVSGDPDQLRRGRLYKVDDELIAVTDAQAAPPPSGQRAPWSRVTLLRGALGTTPQAHSETQGWRLFWPPHVIASGGFAGARGRAIPIRQLQDNVEMREDDGYVAVDRGPSSHPRWADQPFLGVLPFQHREGDHLVRPIDAFERGCFTHAFGSNAVQPVDGDLLVDLPFRPHDRHADRAWSYEGVFFQAGRELPGAYVTYVDWDETVFSGFCEVKVAVRVDGGPSWDAEPVGGGASGVPGLYLFDDPKGPNEVMLRADRVELRVYITFKPTAFYEDAWKRAALVGAVRVHYRQPTQSLRRDERSD